MSSAESANLFWVDWIPVVRIAVFLSLDLFVCFWSLALGGLVVYKLFLRAISAKRHRNFRRRYWRLLITLSLATILAGGFWGLQPPGNGAEAPTFAKFSAYCALLGLFFQSLAMVWIGQLYVYLFLFLKNTQRGVPRLLANICTLLFFLMVFSFVGTYVFGLKIAPVLATSAVFSVILGLALQDTLGSLFAGLSLQLEQPFRLGDWVEVQSGGQKWTGQVQEINWRATFLIGYSDELIVIPNKVLAASQILVFTYENRPGRRYQAFRLPAESPEVAVRRALYAAARDVPQVLAHPEPRVLILEAGEGWLLYKLFYSIQDFGAQYRVGDAVLSAGLSRLREAGLALAVPRLSLEPSPPERAGR